MIKILNKIAIPAILVATVMVAGMFAFMPVEQASTVHTTGTITTANDADIAAILADTDGTLILQVISAATTFDVDTNDEIRVDCDTTFIVNGLILSGATNIQADDEIQVSGIELDGAGPGGTDIPRESAAGFTTTDFAGGALLNGAVDMFDDIFSVGPSGEDAKVDQIISDGSPVDFLMFTQFTEGDETIDVDAMVLAPSNAQCSVTFNEPQN